MGADVFIVHAAVDKPVARALADALERAGVSHFLDERDQKPGAPWDEAIVKQLRQSLLQAVLLGRNDGWYQREEIGLAIKNMRLIGADDRVIPFLLVRGRIGKLPYGLNGLQATAWTSPADAATVLADKVRECRRPSGAERIKVAVVGVKEELGETLDDLARRIGQFSFLVGEVRIVDVASEDPPEVDLTVVMLRARHGGKPELLKALVARSRSKDPNVIAGGWSFSNRDIARAHKDEAWVLFDLQEDLTINAYYPDVLIGQLGEEVARWHEARHPSRPGWSPVREPWETAYLEDRLRSWRPGHSHRAGPDGKKVERSQWYIHLQARAPWVEVAGEVRHQIGLRREELQDSREESALHWVAAAPDASAQLLLDPLLWWGGRRDPAHEEFRDDSAAFRNWEHPEGPVWLDQVLSHAYLRRCLVVGVAGMGKSVLLDHLATVLATDEPAGDPEQPSHRVDRDGVRAGAPIAPVPVLLTAKEVVRHLRDPGGGPRPIESTLAHLLSEPAMFGAPAGVIKDGIEAGRYLFLIDALDEVPSADDRRALVAALGAFERALPRVILTTRPGPYTEADCPTGFVVVEVAPLDQDAAARLAAAWVRTWMPDRRLEHVVDAIEDVRGKFPRRGDDPSPVENPLLLDSLLQVYREFERLPKDVATLYRETVKMLCRRRLGDASDRAPDQYPDALMRLFRDAQERGEVGLSLARAEELLVEARYASSLNAAAWLGKLANHTGLLRYEGAGPATFVRPWHRSYQEYLAAVSLVDELGPAGIVGHLRQARSGGDSWARGAVTASPGSRLMDPFWRGTLRFLIGEGLHRPSKGAELVAALAAAAHEGGGDQARLYRLVAEGVDEYRADFAPEAVERLSEELVRDFEARGKEWPLEDRLGALDALGRLGDPRLKRELWVRIEAGRARVDDESAWEEVDAFELMWRPVTVADYAAFVADPDHARWLGEDAPRYIVGRGQPEDWEGQLEHLNRPVVGVSWYEARAYARWLDAREGGGVRLPTELEWARAAQGEGGHEYVWDRNDHPATGDAAEANYDWGEGSVGHPSPVGAFPRGNRGRLVDLAGNVEEWCLDEYDAGSKRVMRGGSWLVFARFARAAARYAWRPVDRSSSLGFRLARGHQAKQVKPGRSG